MGGKSKTKEMKEELILIGFGIAFILSLVPKNVIIKKNKIMINIEITPREAKLIIYSLNLKNSRKLSSIRRLLENKESVIEKVGEKEFNHRLKLRETTAENSKELSEKILSLLSDEQRNEMILANKPRL